MSDLMEEILSRLPVLRRDRAVWRVSFVRLVVRESPETYDRMSHESSSNSSPNSDSGP